MGWFGQGHNSQGIICRVSEVSRKNKKGGVIIPDDNIT